jgi:radical SAM superfamily enzyme YgiQ (UPF0313 family)
MTKKDKLNITLILAADRNDPLTKRDPFQPLSLPILASVAPDNNYTFIDMLWDAEKINYDTKDEIIGISFRETAEPMAYELADEFLKRGKTVILGGVQPTAVPHTAIQHANAVVIGEGEELWPMALDDYRNNALKDFYVCSPQKFDAQGKSFYQTKDLPDLQNLPKPIRSLFKRKYDFELTYASRGCPINCDFCTVSFVFGKKMRFRPIDDVVDEIKGFRRFYYLLDDTVFGRPHCYDYYIELYEKIAQLPKRKYWTGQINLDAANSEKGREVIRKAAKAGLIYAAAGVESVNYKTLKDSGSFAKMGVGKDDDYLKKMKENIAFIQSQGIIISGWFAIGYETDTVQTYYDTLKFCEETNILPVFTPVRALAGSRLWDKMEAEGRLQDSDTHVSNIRHPKLTDEEIEAAMIGSSKMGFTSKMNWKRMKFHFNLFRKSERNLNDAIYKTIFATITQSRMKGIVFAEIERIENKVGKKF